ncbi:MAG: Lrp/AsnC family transcriptional regulator [Oscillospiraceae bacterium]|nr:Lrp/AsnC family transcriptional regulator [Oscillospiraceae bacterium]
MIDSTDIKILKALKANARVNASEIAGKINMSVSAVIERIKKLELSGVINRYTVLLDHKKLNMDIAAFMSVSMEHPKYNDAFVEAVNSDSRIVECNYITGDFDYLLKLVTTTTDDLYAALKNIKSIPGVSLTRTQLVLFPTKNEVTILPDEASR